MPGQPCCSGFFFARNIINQSSRTTCLIQRRRSIWNDTRKVVPEGGFEPPTRGFSILELAPCSKGLSVGVASMLHLASVEARNLY
jgi:hypothetical protein